MTEAGFDAASGRSGYFLAQINFKYDMQHRNMVRYAMYQCCRGFTSQASVET